MEEPGRLLSMGLLRVRHDWATSLSLFTFMHRRRKWQPVRCSCLENPRDGGAWWASVYGVTQSRTRLKRLSSSSSSKESTCNAGDLGLIPALGRSPGEWKDYPLQYSGLENSMDNILHGVAESDMTEPLSLASFCIVNSCMFHVSWEVGRS